MNISKRNTAWFLSLSLAFFVGTVQAGVPTSGAYAADTQQEFVQDQATESITTAQMIMCFMYNVRADLMVNAGKYIAFIDEDACDTSGRASASNSTNQNANGATSFTRMSIDSVKPTASKPQTVKGHAESKEEGGSITKIYIHSEATESPSPTAPNGIMTMNFTGIDTDGSRQFRGELGITASGLNFSETGSYGGSEETIRLYVDGNETSGSGAVVAPRRDGTDNTDTIVFGYNNEYFCRAKNGGTEYCFSRSKADADSTVWRYGTYDDSTGAKYDLAQPGFSIKDSDGKYGFASYWGIWLPTAPSDGDTVTNTAGDVSYTVKQGKGRLIKYSRVQSTLDGIKKVPFVFRTEASATVASTSYNPGTEFEAYWDDENDNFVITGTQECGSSGCNMKKITGATMSATEIKTATTSGSNAFGVRGWSRGLGGSVEIKAATLSASDPGAEADGVRYLTQAVVNPGDTVPTTLKCVRDCPTDASLDVISDSDSPFTTGTYNKWGQVGAGAVETYTWDTNNYTLTDGASAVVNSDALPSGDLSGRFEWGIRSGPLVADTDLSNLECEWDSSYYCDWRANDLSAYYVFETGKKDWNTATFLKKSDDTYLAFTAPEGANFTVPSNTSGTSKPYGDFAGAPLRLEFMGFGELHGIPGKCFSTTTNQEVDCGEGTRYVPAFTIPSDSDGYVTINSSTKWIKWLERELRFKPESGVTSSAQNITLGAVANLPAAQVLTGDAKDPSMAANTTYYPGDYDSVNWDAAPSVIQGVKQ